MTAQNDKESVKAQPPAEGTPDAPLDRIWSDPIGTGEIVPFDPTLYEPGMSDEEVKKLLEELEQE